VLSAIADPRICEPFSCRRANELLDGGQTLILAGGTGSPFFTTDTCAALRASEIGAEVVLKATTVDGVYDSDPKRNPAARKYDRLTYSKVLADKLGVMDLTAISLCMESRLPIMVFALAKAGNLAAAVCGQNVGTMITSEWLPDADSEPVGRHRKQEDCQAHSVDCQNTHGQPDPSARPERQHSCVGSE